MQSTQPLVIGYVYDTQSYYKSLDFSSEDCAEFDTEETVEAIIQSIKSLGHEVIPICGIKQLVSVLAEEEHKKWDLAFASSEGMYGAGREAQVSGLLEAYQIPHVFSDAATLSLTLDKGKTKVTAVFIPKSRSRKPLMGLYIHNNG